MACGSFPENIFPTEDGLINKNYKTHKEFQIGESPQTQEMWN